MDNAFLPWVEKYRPTTINEIISHGQIIETIKKLLFGGSLPHLLFYGSPGTGKTSTIMAIAKEIYGNNIPYSMEQNLINLFEKYNMTKKFIYFVNICVINIILICFLASASNSLLEKPGMPTIPVPSKFNRQISFILDMPLIKFLSTFDTFLIIVPAWLGSKVFFIHTGIFFCITG